jgi:deferrochelatase/peroxidase EfeB
MSQSQRQNGPGPRRGQGPFGVRVTRRGAIAGAAMLGAGAALDRTLSGGGDSSPAAAVAFHGEHQAGIATPIQSHLHFAAFDMSTSSRRALRGLLASWTDAAASLTAGTEYVSARAARIDTGEALDLSPARLTLTFGFGPGLFERGRFGLANRRPPMLEPLPPFAGENLDPESSGGELCVQACADDAQVAFHAIHVLSLIADGTATLRWAQLGFRRMSNPAGPSPAPRNLLGFRDGTNNLKGEDVAAMSRFVWVAAGEGPAWLEGGSYLIARRIEIAFPAWDVTPLDQQERTIGRRKRSGAPLTGRREHDPVDLSAIGADGRPVIPLDAHIRLASAHANAGRRLLRRGYSYSRGITPGPLDRGGHQIDGGLFFIAFARDPRRQFIPLARRLATHDALNAFAVHTASAIFACPPGVRPGGYIGQGLLA